jgi:hypothetical protein
VRGAGEGSAVPGEAWGAAMKACVNCEHYARLPFIPYDACMAPNVGLDPITGRTRQCVSAHLMRESDSFCGVDAFWFVERPPKPPKKPGFWQKLRFW